MDPLRKLTLGAFAVLPMAAGFLIWIAIECWFEMYAITQWSERRRAVAGTSIAMGVTIGIAATLVCVAFHVASWLTLRSVAAMANFLEMGKTAWRVLFATGYVAGFVMGVFIAR